MVEQDDEHNSETAANVTLFAAQKTVPWTGLSLRLLRTLRANPSSFSLYVILALVK